MNKKIKPLLYSFMLSSILLFSYASFCYAVPNEECMQCHAGLFSSTDERNADKRTVYINADRFEHSAHNLNGITCVDCHAAIRQLDYRQPIPHAKPMTPVSCATCHPAEEEAFQDSIHSKARGKGFIMHCHACHDQHYATRKGSSPAGEKHNAMCLRCHNPYRTHDWLPQKDAHFSLVECSACHAPGVAHQIHLTFFDLLSNQFLTSKEVIDLLHVDYAGFLPLVDTDRNGVINSDELDTLVLMLRQRGVHIAFHAELVAQPEPAVHQINSRPPERSCEKCHSAISPFFNDVSIVLPRDDGSVDHYEVDRLVLESYHLRLYAMAGTRIRALDKLGIALLAGAVLVVVCHLTARIATIPTRRRATRPAALSTTEEVSHEH